MAEAAETEHAPGLGLMTAVGLALLLLALGTFLVSRLELGKAELPVAMGFATAKAVLIAIFFMHLREHHGGSRMAVGVCVTFIAVLMTLVLTDVGFRSKPNRPPGPVPYGNEPIPSTLAIRPLDFHPPEGGRGRPDQGRSGE